MRFVRLGLLLAAVSAWPGLAQTWDTSGNGQLKGTYYFREVIYAVGDSTGSLADAAAWYGNITFSGTGTYTTSATIIDLAQGSIGSGNASGTYSISSSGYGFISNPLLSSTDSVYVLVSKQGIVVGSSTESGFNDLFIAVPVSTPAATNATFKGTYWVSDTDLSSGSPLNAISTLFQLNPDGAGNLGPISVSGYVGQNGSSPFTQAISGVKYVFSNGAASVNFPNSNTAVISGQRFLYISPDGNFIFGGSPVSVDMFVGVRTTSDAPNFGGTYYQAGVDEDDSQLAAGFGNLDTYFGALSANGGNITGHQRLADVFNTGTLDFTYHETYTVKPDGTYATGAMRYVVGAGGTIRIGSGIGPFLGLNVAVAAPSLSGDGVFLNPQGVVNAGSSAPFTAAIAPGEFLALYGTNLSAETKLASDVPFPTSLGGVRVLINGVAAPLYSVSPTQIQAIVPYGTTTAIAQIQVDNAGTLSNTVTAFTALTAPGVFTSSQTGIGTGAILHSDYSLVTAANPAKQGETVSVFLTGLGAVNPTIADGAAGPLDTFSLATNTITAYVGNKQATVGYAGLAPGIAGLYQVNLTLPTGLTAGDNSLDISGPDSYTSQATIPVAAASASAVTPAPLSMMNRIRNSSQPSHQPKGRRNPAGKQ